MPGQDRRSLMTWGTQVTDGSEVNPCAEADVRVVTSPLTARPALVRPLADLHRGRLCLDFSSHCLPWCTGPFVTLQVDPPA